MTTHLPYLYLSISLEVLWNIKWNMELFWFLKMQLLENIALCLFDNDIILYSTLIHYWGWRQHKPLHDIKCKWKKRMKDKRISTLWYRHKQCYLPISRQGIEASKIALVYKKCVFTLLTKCLKNIKRTSFVTCVI